MADTTEDYKARQAAEYGTYVANGPIYIDGALAFLEGHPVPVSHVKKYGYLTDGLVRKADEPAPESAAPAVEYPQGEPVELGATNTEKKD